MLKFLSAQSSFYLWLIFLIENLIITGIALISGWFILKLSRKPIKAATKSEILICLLTNCINTIVTYIGFHLWQTGYIIFHFQLTWHLLTDFFLLFMVMDLAMYIFHYFIHNSFVYNIIHRFHHNYSDPIPIDLFVLHPIETICFGCLWISVIYLINFNFYAVLIYLIVNVIFGISGHLGIEPLPSKLKNIVPFKYLGTSSFHHLHHSDVHYNYGFYTNLWDKLFRTYKA